ncbi:alpha/beta hydrolase [Lentzea nigeriaca]|uniref:alpha/beta hydrolase n=1 Tax=Lentzea nigeriaca TaxID=1128665 RepID=UPI001959A93E|nr:alpha/beta hydrolase [Lentzea nigeriaca]MBM7864232.1 pimeloyl-ACP methyl ester carboxylesterase [Lentzea nigeriaca]
MSAAVLVSVLSGGTAYAEPAPPISWVRCPDNPEGECGRLSVPLDWKRPGGQRIDLAVARHAATDPARRLGVLMVDPGGPGGSAADFALSRLFSPELRARFDIVGIDSRGTGKSLAIRCADLVAEQPPTYPADKAGFTALLRFNQGAVEKCRARSGPIFDHADSAVVAQDMDAVRRALGERKISYLGLSYGTVFGQAYAEKFGHRLRAMVLDSVVDHSADLKRFMGDRAAAADDSFVEFVRWCDRTDSCVLHGKDVYAAWEAALVRADGEPLGRQRLIDSMYGALRGPDWAYAAELVAGTETRSSAARSFEPNYESVRLATVCQDFSLRIKDFRQYARLRAEELRRSPIMRGSLIGHDEAAACAGVARPPSNPPHRLDLRHAPKIMVLSARHDPTTPYDWAVNIHRQAPRNTALMTYEGWGHVAYPRSECTRGGVDAYLLDLTVPARSCPAVES